MFGKKNNPNQEPGGRTTASSSSLMHNSIVQGTKIEGTIHSENDFRLDGTLKGDLNCKNKVIIGKNGTFDGTIKCASAVIEGKFDGILMVTSDLIVKQTAIVRGEVTTDNLSVEQGSVFQVTCKMKNDQADAAKSKSPSNNPNDA